jgi:hypothetical protein
MPYFEPSSYPINQSQSLPDETPVRSYQVHLSDRQVESLKSLKRRNFSGLTLGVANEFRALARMVDEVCIADDDSLDNYD